jgi:hypothetical protein
MTPPTKPTVFPFKCTGALIVGLIIMVLASQTGVVKADRALFDLEPSERLSREDLLSQIKGDHQVEPAIVAMLLSEAKEKNTTEILDGVTVAQLLAQNRIGLEGCGAKLFRKRVLFCGTFSANPDYINVELYCRRLVHDAAEYCVHEKDKLMGDSNWLAELEVAVKAMENQEPLTPSNTKVTAVEWCVLLGTARYPARLINMPIPSEDEGAALPAPEIT